MLDEDSIVDQRLGSGLQETGEGTQYPSDRELCRGVVYGTVSIHHPMRVGASKKHGFTIMAVSCLLIEALESFRLGWPDSNGKSQLAFCNFFDRNKNFHFIRGYSQSFYRNVRCGILHQGETTGGWHIKRTGPVFDVKTKTLNAKKFHDEIEKALEECCVELRQSGWKEPIWKSLRKKLSAVCKNCE